MTTIKTPITELLGIKNPIMLAGMNKAAGAKLAAAVTNAGGLGVIGGVNYTPRMLQKLIKNLKKHLNDKNAPFGVDLLIPQVGGSARKTNHDYTRGKLDELIDVIIESGAKLFVSAVGVPPKQVVERLHKANILVMNMVGHPKHVIKAINAGVDLICAQGGEGGGHTGHVPQSLLVPKCVDLCRGHVSPLTGQPIYVVAAGGIYDGRGLVAALGYGAHAVWIGTRFVASIESGASKAHKQAVINSSYDGTYRTEIYTGRPMRITKNKYVDDWNANRGEEMKELLQSGVVPIKHDLDSRKIKMGDRDHVIPHLSGQVAGAINEILPATKIMENMMTQAIGILQGMKLKIAKL